MRAFVVFALFAAFAGSAYSAENQHKATNIDAQSPKPQERGTDDRPIVTKILPAGNNGNQATHKEKNKPDRPNQEERTADATWALFYVTLALAIFTAFLFGATYLLVREAKDTARRQLRAYISIAPGEVIEQNERGTESFEFHPNIVNDGQTPAHDLIFNATVDLLPFPLPQNFNFPLPPLNAPSVSVLGPRQSKFMISFSLRRFTIDELHEILLHGNQRLYLYGTVTYTDVFADTRYTNFCFTIQWGSRGGAIYITNQYHNDAT